MKQQLQSYHRSFWISHFKGLRDHHRGGGVASDLVPRAWLTTKTHSEVMAPILTHQWQIHDFAEDGAPTTNLPSYYFGQFFPQNCVQKMKTNESEGGGGRVPGAPPWIRRCTWLLPYQGVSARWNAYQCKIACEIDYHWL